MILTTHSGTGYKGTTQAWLSFDSKERYDNNFKKSYKQLQEFGWINTEIQYTFNSDGFRTTEFTNLPEKYFVSVGCSNTFGVGVCNSQTWTSVLSNNLNLPGLNLGSGGAALNTCYRLLKHYLSMLDPEFIVLQEPGIHRMELFGHNDFQVIVPTLTLELDTTGWGDYYKRWQSYDANAQVAESIALDAISFICSQKNIPLYFVDNDKSMYYLFKCQQRGRDLMHPGPKGHRDFAEHVQQKIINRETYY